jgi:polyprenyl P-hydroxybenzoate/phenylacrylic acid decarboxylase-like protein
MKLVVAASGASGAIYTRRVLEVLGRAQAGDYGDTLDGPRGHFPADQLWVHWVATDNAAQVWREELHESMPTEIPHARRWSNGDFHAPFASGSNPPDAVMVVPCSMSSLARVAHGGGSGLVARACDVALKERRALVLVARETPLSLVHLRNMTAATEAGAVVLPAVPSFYVGDASLEHAIDSVVMRALDSCGLRLPLLPRWGAST